jgi:tetratricopeptide (TPR) repeat protein
VKTAAAAVAALVVLSTIGCANRETQFRRLQADCIRSLRTGDLAAAATQAQQGLLLAEASSDPYWDWTFRLLRAETQLLELNFAAATADLTQAIPPDPKFAPLQARQHYLNGKACVTRGDLRCGLEFVRKGSVAAQTGFDTQMDLTVLTGQIRLRLGERKEAEALLASAVEQSSKQGDRYHQALALNDLGMGRLIRNQFDEALALFERVLSFDELRPYTIYASSLNNAGICRMQLGDFDGAISLQKRVVEVRERVGSPDRLEHAVGELGRTYLAAGDVTQGMKHLQRAFDLSRSAQLDADAVLWASALADAYIERRDWDQAARFNDQAIRLRHGTATGKAVWNTLYAADIAHGRGQLDEAEQLFQRASSASQDEPSVGWEAHAGLARVALGRGQAARASDSFERALEIIEKTRSGLLKTDYKLSYLTSLIQFYGEYVEALIEQGQVGRALEIADSSRGRVLSERQHTASPTRVSASAFRSALKQSGAVALSYWLQPTVSWLWIVTPDEIHLAKLPAGDRIASLVRDYQGTIASTISDPLGPGRTAGDELYAALVEPAARWIPAGAKILIVHDGALHGLNFETLPVPEPRRHYWIEDVEIQAIPSLGLLTAPTDRREAHRADQPRSAPTLLLIGSPSVSDPKFPALRYASSEMTKVAAHFDPGQVVSYTGPRASPAAYRAASPERFSMIHFAAHAATNVESPLDSAVVLASDNGAYKLYARDIASGQESLRAELVTISACRGAGERAFSGEGLVGFAWAFLRAGAHRVIAGLWDVDDQSTADLMDTLYSGLAQGQPPAQALRQAKLAMLRRGGSLSRPFHWGPFELFTTTP